MSTRDAIGFGRVAGLRGVAGRIAPLAIAVACAASAACGGQPGDDDSASVDTGCSAEPGVAPATLGCTRLYASSDGSRGAIANDVLEFAPARSLWSDGAEKRRFVRLPAGTTIDSRNMDEWVFPPGTQLWKEFSVGGHKVETRYLEKRADGTWLRTTYAWTDDGTAANEVTTGVTNVRGTGYDIPAQSECSECHDGATDGVLGFEAIGLSSPGATGLTMQELIRRGLLSQPPAAVPVIPGSPLDVAALGWLHANCGNACHNGTARAEAGWTGLHMRLTTGGLASVEDTDTYKTAVGITSGFQPSPDAGLLRIKAGDPAHSAIVVRAGSRNRDGQMGWQMPPIASNVPDVADVNTLEAWIQGL